MIRKHFKFMAVAAVALAVPAYGQEIAPVGKITPVGKLTPVEAITPVGKLQPVTTPNAPVVTADSIPFLNKLPSGWWNSIPLSTDVDNSNGVQQTSLPASRTRPEADGPYVVFTMTDPRNDEDWGTQPRVFETREQAERFARTYQAKNGPDSLAYPQKVDAERWEKDRFSWIDERKQVLDDVRDRWLKPLKPVDTVDASARQENEQTLERLRASQPAPLNEKDRQFIDEMREKYRLNDPVKNQIEGALRNADEALASLKTRQQLDQIVREQAAAARQAANDAQYNYVYEYYDDDSGDSSGATIGDFMNRINDISNFAWRSSGYQSYSPPSYDIPSFDVQSFPSFGGSDGGYSGETLIFDDSYSGD